MKQLGGAFAAVLLAVVSSAATCNENARDGIGSGDERIDEPTRRDRSGPDAGVACTSEPKGNLVLLDARTASPLGCELVTVSREPEGCAANAECSPIPLVQGRTNALGQVSVSVDLATSRLSAVSEGYAVSYREPSAVPAGQSAELELHPSNGLLLKLLDASGNYLAGRQVTFRQGEEVIATMKTNELANVFFGTRAPFSGQPVVVEMEGFAPLTLHGAQDLGADGHTVTLQK